MRRTLVKLVATGLLAAAGATANAQANYWNFSGTYFNTSTGAVATTPTNINDLNANAFPVPGLCNTYYRANWVNTWGPPHGSDIVISDISANTSGHPFNATGDQKYLFADGYMHSGNFAPTKLANDGTRRLYFTGDYAIMYWTINVNGTVSAPTTVYTFTGTNPFDPRIPTEMSSDGKYLLAGNGTTLIAFDIATNTIAKTFTCPISGGNITGYEYVTGWGANPRVYISCNNTWFNPSGTGSLGYYDFVTGAFTTVTSYPSGTTAVGFGFTEIEQAKNGKLYMVFCPSGYITNTISATGTLYSYSSAGAWAAVSGVSIPGNNSNWGYTVQTQIDGENYNNSYYATPAITSLLVNGIPAIPGGSTVATLNICSGSSILPLEATISGLYGSYTINVDKVTWSGSSYVQTDTRSYSSSLPSNFVSKDLYALWPGYLTGYNGIIRIRYALSSCANTTTTYLLSMQSAGGAADFYLSTPSCSSPTNKKPAVTALPIADYTFPTTVAGRNALCSTGAAPAYLGASSAGIDCSNITTSATNWLVKVYEVDPVTGGRIGADIVNMDDINYNGGPTSPLLPPAYMRFNDVTISGSPDFQDWLVAARTAGSAALAAYGKQVFKVEFSATVPINPTTNCNVYKYSYFRIATNATTSGTGNSANWKGIPTTPNADLLLYPNPASTTVSIKPELLDDNGVIDLTFYDISGKKVQQLTNVSTLQVDVSALSAGFYTYTVRSGAHEYKGKLMISK